MIGLLKLKKTPSGIEAEGGFRTLTVGLNFTLAPRGGKQAENAPTHDAYVVMQTGETVPIGVAWLKEIQRGNYAGEPMFSITLDDPSFDAPLNLNAYPRGKQATQLEIVWERPRRRPEGAMNGIGSPAFQGNAPEMRG